MNVKRQEYDQLLEKPTEIARLPNGLIDALERRSQNP